jgi:hypothetical protein
MEEQDMAANAAAAYPKNSFFILLPPYNPIKISIFVAGLPAPGVDNAISVPFLRHPSDNIKDKNVKKQIQLWQKR